MCSVVAHVIVAAVQHQGSSERVGGPLAAAAGVCSVDDGVQTPVGEGRVHVERVQDLREAGVQF